MTPRLSPRIIALVCCLLPLSLPTFANEEAPAETQEPTLEGDYLYRVTTMRAAPGKLKALLAWCAQMKDMGFFEQAGTTPPFILRHSQGDQWDLMKIIPMGSWTDYHAPNATKKRARAANTFIKLMQQEATLLAFAEDHFAYGPPPSLIEPEWSDNTLLHVEMFAAAPGKAAALLEERRMENAYLSSTGQVSNMIFRRAAGSDVDVFTIGFHKNLEAFAAPAPVSDAQKEQAAIEAGFKDRADLSFYLRTLIVGHHDTLAYKVK